MDEANLKTKGQLEQMLAECDAFMQTALYRSIQATYLNDLAKCEQSILACCPETTESLAASIKLFGRREELTTATTFFKDTRDHLEQLLENLLEAEANEDHDNNET